MDSIYRRRLSLLAALCLLSLLHGNTQAQDIPLFTSDFPPQEFAARRSKMYDSIGEGGLALVQGAAAPVGYTRFRQSNEFYYLCGVEVPHAYLLLKAAQRTAALYLPHRNEGRERGEGKMLSAEDAELLRQMAGVDAVFGTDLLNEHLTRYARGTARTIYTPFSPAEGFAMSRDLALRAVADRAADPFDGVPSREGMFVQNLRARLDRKSVV